MISQTEENYLKAIFKVAEKEGSPVSTNAISAEMNTSAASVTDMLKRLAEKDLIFYERYKGVTLTVAGNGLATGLVRKHRLWEVFLVDKLGFAWDEVHEMAEQLEHIQSPELIERLDKYLGRPQFDPHGDPIPDAQGRFTFRQQIPLAELGEHEKGVVVGVGDHSVAFLQYLDRLALVLGVNVEVVEKFAYDDSAKIKLDNGLELIVSNKVCQHLFVKKQ